MAWAGPGRSPKKTTDTAMDTSSPSFMKVAGSTTPLYECVRRAISFGIPARDAFAMASETPAEMLGLKKGKLRRGYAAEFVLCNEDYELQKALVL